MTKEITKEEKELNILIGCQIKELRIIRGLSCYQLEGRMEVSYQQLQKYEEGISRILRIYNPEFKQS